MKTFQHSAKIICFSVILFGLSSLAFGQNTLFENEAVLASETVQDGEVEETKAEVIWRKNAELTTKGITQNRDMRQYEQGGYFDCRGWAPKGETRGECSEIKIQNFIWQNWASKKRAYIRVTHNSVDATSTSHIFIEPDKNGEWRIAWRIVRAHAIPELNNLIHDILSIVSVEQIKDKPVKGLWALAFKNKSGQIVQKMPSFYE